MQRELGVAQHSPRILVLWVLERDIKPLTVEGVLLCG